MAEAQEEEEMAREFYAKYKVLEETRPREAYKAKCSSTGRFVHLRRVQGYSGEGVPSTAIREIALLKELSHENVVQLLDFFLCSSQKVYLVFEFVDLDLKTYMKGQGNHLDPPTIKSLSYQLCKGVEFCHANRVVHRELRPQHLLVDSKLRLKIAEFGWARTYTLPTPNYDVLLVEYWYRPLEILLGSSFYSVPVDMWGVGCTLAEMATGSPLFCGDSEIETMFDIFQKLGTPTSEQWPGVADLPHFKMSFPKWKPKGWENIRNTRVQIGPAGIDLLEKFMIYDPRKRLTARRGLQHPYFVDVEVPEPAE